MSRDKTPGIEFIGLFASAFPLGLCLIWPILAENEDGDMMRNNAAKPYDESDYADPLSS